jgi:charged multivesicular body protein 7
MLLTVVGVLGERTSHGRGGNVPPMSSPLSPLPTYSTTSNSRLQSLYSDISRQKHSNPTSYHSNVDWWRMTLEMLVARGWPVEHTISTRSRSDPDTNEIVEKESDKLILNAGRGLAESLRYEGVGKPLGLGTVIVSPAPSPPAI